MAKWRIAATIGIMKMKTAMPFLAACVGLAAAQPVRAQTFEAPENPLPPLEDIQPADTPTMLPANDAAPYPAASYLEERRPPEPRSRRGMLKRQYRWLPEHEAAQAQPAPALPPQPTGLPPEANPPRDVQGAPLHNPNESASRKERQRARPDLRERERPGGLGRFAEPPLSPNPADTPR